MNKIAILGLLPFALMAPYFRSPPMVVIFILGVIFHINPENKILFIIDTTTNTYFFIIGAIQCPDIVTINVFVITVFVLNGYLLKSKKHSELFCNVIHTVFIQWVGIYAFYHLWRLDPCNKYFFICNK